MNKPINNGIVVVIALGVAALVARTAWRVVKKIKGQLPLPEK